jgi:hypothetical protein
MTRRLVFWALTGFVVAWGWVMFGAGPGFGANFSRWIVVQVTAPASLVGQRMSMTWFQFMVLNAAIYGVLGLGIEAGRGIFRMLHDSEGSAGELHP